MLYFDATLCCLSFTYGFISLSLKKDVTKSKASNHYDIPLRWSNYQGALAHCKFPSEHREFMLFLNVLYQYIHSIKYAQYSK